MRTRLQAFFATALLFTGCHSQTSEGVRTVSPKDFAQKIKETPDAQILDVRTAEEFAGGHLDKATNIDWYEKDRFDSGTAKLDKSKPVFVYCAAGSRSIKAASKLNAQGFATVYNLDGGIVKWNAQNTPTETAEPSKIIGMCSQEYGDLIKSQHKVLVDFYAPWCEPCKKMAPYLKRMEADDALIKTVRLDADEHKTLVAEMKIDALPRLLFYVDGKLVWQHDGFLSEEDLKKQLQ